MANHETLGSLVFLKHVRGHLLWNHPEILIKKIKFWTFPRIATQEDRNSVPFTGSGIGVELGVLFTFKFDICVCVLPAQLIQEVIPNTSYLPYLSSIFLLQCLSTMDSLLLTMDV